MMRLILLGPPGAGKGTQAAKLMAHFNIPQIATGDMLRAAIASGSALGREAQAVMESGQLVSDEIIIALVKARLSDADCQGGFLFDGYPRTIAQADALRQAHVSIDHVVQLVVPDEDIIERITGRRLHQASGRIYHVQYNPPVVEGLDDVTGEKLVQRDDDTHETVSKRLAIYHQQTEPLVTYYKSWSETGDKAAPGFDAIDGTGDVKRVFNDILKVLNNPLPNPLPQAGEGAFSS